MGFKIDYPHARRSYSDSGFGDDDQLELSKTFGEFIDSTQSSVGFALNKLASDTNTNFTINKSVSDALALFETDSNFIPSIFAASAYDYNYRLSSVCLRIPVAKTEDGLAIDDSKLDSISIIN